MPFGGARRLLAPSVAILLTLAACGGNGDDGTTPDEATVPEGGWPQPVNGQLTDDMCQLLAPADYSAVGHEMVLPLEPQGDAAAPASNAVSCLAPPADALTMALQPTAEAAQIWYEATVAARARSLENDGGQSVRAEDMVDGADASWFDYWLAVLDGEFQDYELLARRGALVIDLTMSVNTAEETDPLGSLVTLAELVLERIPDVGATDTGTTPVVALSVTGTGPASIQYNVDEASEKLDGVQLPWSVEVPFADHGETPTFLNLSAQADVNDAPIGAPLACAISANGTVIVEQESTLIVTCLTEYTPE